MDFSKKFKELRKQRNLTGEQVGSALGVKKQTVSGWERGVITPPLSKLSEIANFFDVDINTLLGYENSMPSSTFTKTIDVSGLDEKTIDAIKLLIEGLRSKN